MKIYMPIIPNNPHQLPNPFISTLTDEIVKNHKYCEFWYDIDFLWSKNCEDIDILHIMWPQVFSYNKAKAPHVEERLKELKAKGVCIIATCHNLYPHVMENEYIGMMYEVFYSLTDTFIHLGEYSKRLFEKKYPSANHIIIPHHVYDTKYGEPKVHSQSLNDLGLSKKYRYILCLGAFRNDAECDLVVGLGQSLKKEGIRILAPSIMELPYGARNPKLWIKPLLKWYNYRRDGIWTIGRYVKDKELTTFYGAADIALIQRPSILNSGNLPMGLYMGKVVVGPNVGNVGEILKETGNPVFDPGDNRTLVAAVMNAFVLTSKEKGKHNRAYSLENLTTQFCAESVYRLYISVKLKG